MNAIIRKKINLQCNACNANSMKRLIAKFWNLCLVLPILYLSQDTYTMDQKFTSYILCTRGPLTASPVRREYSRVFHVELESKCVHLMMQQRKGQLSSFGYFYASHGATKSTKINFQQKDYIITGIKNHSVLMPNLFYLIFLSNEI